MDIKEASVSLLFQIEVVFVLLKPSSNVLQCAGAILRRKTTFMSVFASLNEIDLSQTKGYAFKGQMVVTH